MKNSLICAATVAAFLGVFACSSHDDDHSHGDGGTGGHVSPYAACQTIIDACHEYDVGEGPVHDCHDLAHDAKGEGDCTPKKDDCLKTCAAAAQDAGGSETGAGDSAAEGGSDAGHDH